MKLNMDTFYFIYVGFTCVVVQILDSMRHKCHEKDYLSKMSLDIE